jgi:teichuronic acid biosynthesis glycosyltransferase TuaG
MANRNPLISVILPCYNSSRFVARAILSVLNQTYKNLELIIVDDCSTDETKKIIKKFLKQDNRIKFYSTKKNSKTVAKPRNLGVSKAIGEYVAFLDSDDYWYEGKLDYQMKYIGNFLVSFTAAEYGTESSSRKSNFLITYARIFLQIFFTSLIKNKGNYWLYVYNPFLISSAILKTSLIKKLKFDENKNIREDLTYWLEIFMIQKKIFIFHPKILLTISRSINSLSSNKVVELNKIINSICGNFLIYENYEKYFFFLLGIFLKISKLLLGKVYTVLRKSIVIIIFIVGVIYFTIFYTPFFWHVGNNLIYFNSPKKTELVFILSGHQGFDYINISYQHRFIDAENYINKYDAKNDTKFFIMGKLQVIPEQKILESLLYSAGINKSNISLIYQEYKNTKEALVVLKEILIKDKIQSITIITSPYHTLRVSKIWNEISNNQFDTVIFQNINQPKRNNWFSRSYNKKEILFELLANTKHFIKKLI